MTPMLGLGLRKRNFSSDWLPTALGATMQLWLDASDSSYIISLDMVKVSVWVDKSDEGNNAAQATEASQPSYAVDSFGGLPAITFDGVDDKLISGTTTLGITSSASLAVVLDIPSRTPSTQGIVGADDVTTKFGFEVTSGGAIRWNPVSATNIEVASVTGRQILIGTAQSGATAIFRNGSSIVTGTGSTGTMPSTTFNIGGMLGTTIPHFSGSIAEVIVTNNSMPASTRQRLEGYLAWKWNLVASLPSTHPYKNSSPVT